MDSDDIQYLADEITACFISPNVADRNLEAANVVDVIDRLARSVFSLADSVSNLTESIKDNSSNATATIPD